MDMVICSVKSAMFVFCETKICHAHACVIYILQCVQQGDLIKGLVMPSNVRMNQEGWTMVNIFRFFFNLWNKTRGRSGVIHNYYSLIMK